MHGSASVAVAIIIIALLFVSVFIAWTVRKTNRAKSASDTQHMFRRSSSNRRFNNADQRTQIATAHPGNYLNKGRSAARQFEPVTFSNFPPHTTSVYSLPPLPPRAYVSGTSSASPKLPPHCDMSSARTPGNIPKYGGRQSVEVVFQNLDTSRPGKADQMLLSPSSVTLTADKFWIREGIVNATGHARQKLTLGSKLSDLQVKVDAQSVKHARHQGAKEMSDMEGLGMVVAKDSSSRTHSDPTAPTLRYPPLPSLSPSYTLPSLFITSSSIERDLIVERGQVNANSYLPSPPPTPTLPMLAISLPSTGCGMITAAEGYGSSDVGEVHQSWSDVLSLEEYEREEQFILRRMSANTREKLPSPPPTPTLLFTPPSSPCVLPTAASLKLDEHRLYVGSVTGTVLKDACGEESHKADENESSLEEPLDQAGFRDRLAAFTLTHEQAKVAQARRSPKLETPQIPEVSGSRDESPPPYQKPRFDYEIRLAQKRASSPLTDPPAAPAALTTRIHLRQVTSVVRPRPPLEYFEPLLLRKVDGSRLNTRPSVSVRPPTVQGKKMRAPIPRAMMGFGSGRVMYVPVEVSEQRESKEQPYSVFMGIAF